MATKITRKTRIPLGVPSKKLTASTRDGVRRHWINDKGSRLQDALNGGYTFVSDPHKNVKVGDDYKDGNQDLGSMVSQPVGTTEDGSPLRAYLMEIQQEWYEDDKALKQQKVDEIDDQIRNGVYKRENDDLAHSHSPREGIKYKT